LTQIFRPNWFSTIFPFPSNPCLYSSTFPTFAFIDDNPYLRFSQPLSNGHLASSPLTLSSLSVTLTSAHPNYLNFSYISANTAPPPLRIDTLKGRQKTPEEIAGSISSNSSFPFSLFSSRTSLSLSSASPDTTHHSPLAQALKDTLLFLSLVFLVPFPLFSRPSSHSVDRFPSLLSSFLHSPPLSETCPRTFSFVCSPPLISQFS